MKIRIDALDTLFFRDGKPFTGGEDVWANMQFPPLPSVLYGALRSKYFAEHPSDLKYAEKADDPSTKATDPSAKLKITAIALQTEDSLLFPAPLDYAKIKGKKNDHGKSQLLKDWIPSVISNCSMNDVLSNEPDIIVKPIEHGYLDNNALSAYLQGKEDEIRYTVLSQYMETEPKIGIKRQNTTHATQEGMLYRVEMKRLEGRMGGTHKHLSLFVECNGILLPESGILRIGGEGKAATYMPSKAEFPPKPMLTGKRFKLYFASPAIFTHGWRPNWLKQIEGDNKIMFQGTYGNLELRLVTAIIGKPIFVGGFNMKPPSPKPMRKAVPAGSIYVFELIKGTIQEAVDAFHGSTISEYDSQQGFGLTFVGGVQ